MSEHKKKAWYKKSWVWILVVIGVLVIAGAGGSNSKNKSNTKETTQTSQAAKAEESKPKWDPEVIYPQINAGMTKAQAEQIIGKTSDNCSETAIEGYGSSEFCLYSGGFGEPGSISITYSNGTVQSKSKTGF